MALKGTLETNDYSGRIYRLTWEDTISEPNNSSTIAWELETYGGSNGYHEQYYVEVTFDNQVVYKNSNKEICYPGIMARGVTSPIIHNDNGSKTIRITIKAAVFDTTVNCQASCDFALNVIPRRSIFSSITGDTIGSDITVNIESYNSSYTHQLVYWLGNNEWHDVGGGYGTSITFQPDMSLCSLIPNSSTGTLGLGLRTFDGDKIIGENAYTSILVKVPDSIKPSISISLYDSTENYQNYERYIQGKCKLHITLDSESYYDSSISSYVTTVDGKKYSGNDFTTDYIQSSGIVEVVSTVKDSRGLKNTASTTIDVAPYKNPVIEKLTVSRCDSDGTSNDQGEYAKITVSATASSLGGKNHAQYKLSTKTASSTKWNTTYLDEFADEFSLKEATYIFSADANNSHDIRLELTDEFATAKKETSVSTGFTLMHWLLSGLGFAVGKVAEFDNVFDIGFKTRFYGGIWNDTLPNETNLNGCIVPNIYYLSKSKTYANTPVSGYNMTLEIIGDDNSTVVQRITVHDKENPKIYERCYDSGWGDWLCIANVGGKVLWKPESGVAATMSADHFCNLSEPISSQKNGIVLVFSLYLNGSIKNENFSSHFVPKYAVNTHSGSKHSFFISNASFSYIACKSLSIYDNKITGYNQNTESGTASGITYKNNNYVLRYVIGV